MSSNTLPSCAAQTPLHKMYTFVYRTFIKFILFCRGQALFYAMRQLGSCAFTLIQQVVHNSEQSAILQQNHLRLYYTLKTRQVNVMFLKCKDKIKYY